MQERSKIHVGLDLHKDSISVAAAEPGRQCSQQRMQLKPDSRAKKPQLRQDQA